MSASILVAFHTSKGDGEAYTSQSEDDISYSHGCTSNQSVEVPYYVFTWVGGLLLR